LLRGGVRGDRSGGGIVVGGFVVSEERRPRRLGLEGWASGLRRAVYWRLSCRILGTFARGAAIVILWCFWWLF
jgi:hypothetical protein